MKKHVILLVVLSFAFLKGIAQILPPPGAVINYTQIMLEYQPLTGAELYVVQVVEDTAGPMFAEPLITQFDSSTATIITGLKFGKKYLWRYAGIIKGTQMGWSGPYNFHIAAKQLNYQPSVPEIVVNDTGLTSGGLIVSDWNDYIMDRNGNNVWYLPEVAGKKWAFAPNGDLRITYRGTVTFISIGAAYETDLNGKVLWRTPKKASLSGDSAEFYHHDFQLLPNGNYMVLGDRFIWRKVPPAFLPGKTDTFHFRNPFIRNTDTGMIARIQYGTIIEYNAKGEIVWAWNSENYLADSDIFPLMFQPMNPTNNHDPHLNAFSVDNADEFVYAGFRQINRVIKIHKKTGKVVNSWGDKMPSGEAATGNGFFYHQHSSQILSNGNIAVFNNGNVAEKEKPSSVVVFSQDTPAKIVWQFDCVYDTFFIKSSRAGNVDELPNQNFLVSTGTKHMGQGPASSIFEVTRNKKIVWMAVVNKFQKALYRGHYISSLYPAYFTAQAIGKWQNGKQQIRLFNEGTEPDLYTVELKFEGSTVTERLFAGTVKPGSSLLLNVSPRILPPASSKMEIRVVSKANSNLVRTLNIDITK